MRISRLAVGVASAFLMSCLAMVPVYAADISYIYDPLGRLVGVIDLSSDTAVYRYDAVGNLLTISRHPSNAVSIIQFTPSRGPSGTTVTISGTGFSATAAENTVSFNGTAANVTSSTLTEIVASVPPGATTGPIAVVSPAGSATSASIFTVAASDAPTITTFSPTIGIAGSAVSISGTNFDPIRANNKAVFNNLVRSWATDATTTTVGTTVPAGTGSGRIAVSTPTGTAISSGDFFIPPSPYTAADVQVTGRMVLGGNDHVLTFTTANKIGIVVFDAIAGQQLNLGKVGIAGQVKLLKPDGTTLASTTVTGYDIDTQAPVSGTYSIIVDPDGANVGSVTLTATQPVGGTLTADGPSVPITLRQGQDARLTFTGSAGQWVSLAASDVSSTLSPGCQQWNGFVYLAILRPDGTTLASGSYTQCGGDLDIQLPTSGTYTALVDALGDRAGTLTLTLTQPLSGVITTTDAPLAVTLQPGQDVRRTFNGTAGQWMTFAVGNISSTLSPGCQQWNGSVYLAILNPDGSVLASGYSTQCGNDLDVQLPAAGTYTALVDVEARSGSLTVTLSEPAGGPITPTDAPLAVTLRPGQDVRKAFSGTAGQWVSFALSDISSSLSPGCQQWFNYIAVSIVKPDGATLASTTLTQCGGDLDVQLPVTGTYTALVDVAFAAAGSLTITLSDAVGGPITSGDPPLAVTLRPGQDVRKTFSGAAGQWTSFAVSNVSASLSPGCSPWHNYIFVAILKPDGTTLTSTTVTQCGGDLDVQLPTTGTYAVVIDTGLGLAGSLTVTLSDAVTTTIAINGASVPIELGRRGQDARVTFDGTSGQQVTVRITSNTMCLAVTLLKPDGTTLTTTSSCASAFNLSTQTLPTSGIYTIISDPNLNTGSHTLTVTSP